MWKQNLSILPPCAGPSIYYEAMKSIKVFTENPPYFWAAGPPMILHAFQIR